MSKSFVIFFTVLFIIAFSRNSYSIEKTRYHLSASARNSFSNDEFAPMVGFSTEHPFKINNRDWGFGITGDYIFSQINEADIGLKLYSNYFGDLLFTASTNLKLVFFETTDNNVIDPNVEYNENNGTKAFFGFVITSGIIFKIGEMQLIPQMGLELYNNNAGLILGVNWKI
jgi:hypothetical protein